ncbi:MAG: hypothetical protein ABIF77_00375, partial [bacterium]
MYDYPSESHMQGQTGYCEKTILGHEASSGKESPAGQASGTEGATSAAEGNTSRVVEPGTFKPNRHFYPQVLNAHIHPLVRYFLDLGNSRIAERCCHLHPEALPSAVHSALSRKMCHFQWAGADLLKVATEGGLRSLVVLEVNSCPSGQKSMPPLSEREEQAGYRNLLERTFATMLRRRHLPLGGLAVLYDKNQTEVAGYAAVLADLTEQPVHLVPCFDGDPEPKVRFTETNVLEINAAGGGWHPIRAALRYVTQRPWNRLPLMCRTLLFNPVLVCLAGGRNKMLAAKAYDMYNSELRSGGLKIRTPETIWDVTLNEVPFWVERLGGVAVVKVPYSNAGQGVYTITSDAELKAFLGQEHRYDRFIVQALIGNVGWSSRSRDGRLYHVGMMPTAEGEIFAADLRFMVGSGAEGFFPVAMYARRAPEPLAPKLTANTPSSWEMLGTNLSFRRKDGSWGTATERLL